MGEKQLKRLVDTVHETAMQKTAYQKVAASFRRKVGTMKSQEISRRIIRKEADSSVKIEHPWVHS